MQSDKPQNTARKTRRQSSWTICTRPTPRHVSRSRFFDTRVVLVCRLFMLGLLLGHFVFFAFDDKLPATRYTVWNFALVTLTFFLTVMASLLEVIDDEDGEEEADEARPTHEHADDVQEHQPHGKRDSNVKRGLSYHSPHRTDVERPSALPADVEKQAIRQARPPRPYATKLANMTAPVYQVALTATLFGTLLYLIFLHQSLTYQIIMQAIVAPALLTLDYLLTCNMPMRLIIIPVYLVYNILFGLTYATRVFISKHADESYAYFNYNVLPRGDFILRMTVLMAASLLFPFLVYLVPKTMLTLMQRIRNGRRKPNSAEACDAKRTSDETEAQRSGAVSMEITSASSDDEHMPGKTNATSTAADTTTPVDDAHADGDNAADIEIGNTSGIYPLDIGHALMDRPREDSRAHVLEECLSQGVLEEEGEGVRDRVAKPLIQRVSSTGSNASGSTTPPWRRVNSAQWFGASRSSSSVGSDGGDDDTDGSATGMSRRVRSLTGERESSWTSMESPVARLEAEYFKMPAVLESHGLAREIVKLTPCCSMVRSTSSRSVSSHGTFGRMSRSASSGSGCGSGGARRVAGGMGTRSTSLRMECGRIGGRWVAGVSRRGSLVAPSGVLSGNGHLIGGENGSNNFNNFDEDDHNCRYEEGI